MKRGYSYDDNGLELGRYVWFDQEEDTKHLDNICFKILKNFKANKNYFVSLDLETQGLRPRYDKILLHSLSWNGTDSVVFSPHHLPTIDSYEEVLSTVPINNNNVKFDAKFILHNHNIGINIKFDPMVAAQLAYPGILRKGDFGMASLAKKLLHFEVGKDIRETFIGMPIDQPFTDEQIKYAARDSIISHRLVKPLVNRLEKIGHLKFWEEIECPLLQYLYPVEYQGVGVDVEVMKVQLEESKVLLFNLKDRMTKTIASEFGENFLTSEVNPNSPAQKLKILQKYGFRVTSSAKEILQELYEQNPTNKFLELLIEYNQEYGETTKLLTQLLEKHVDYKKNVVYQDYFTCGAASGRLCVHEDTKIYTSQGLKRIKDIQPKVDHVLTKDGTYEEVSALIFKGFEELFAVRISYARSIICTKNHRFLTPFGWRSLANLAVGDDITLANDKTRSQAMILKITSVGEAGVWDISVPCGENYVSEGGFINHNSSSPNLQNIPKKNRSIFVVKNEDNYLSSSDYNAFEFRVAAAESQEDSLIEGFNLRKELHPSILEIAKKYRSTNVDDFVKKVTKKKQQVTLGEEEQILKFRETDIHIRNSAQMFNITIPEVTEELRTICKCVGLDTFVTTKEGIFSLRELLPSRTKADTFYDIEHQVRSDCGYKLANKAYYNGKHEGIELCLYSGKTILASPTHKFRTIKNGKYCWATAAELDNGSYVICNIDNTKLTLPKTHKDDAKTIAKISSYLFSIEVGEKDTYSTEKEETLSLAGIKYKKSFSRLSLDDTAKKEYNDFCTKGIPAKLLNKSEYVVKELILQLIKNPVLPSQILANQMCVLLESFGFRTSIIINVKNKFQLRIPTALLEKGVIKKQPLSFQRFQNRLTYDLYHHLEDIICDNKWSKTDPEIWEKIESKISQKYKEIYGLLKKNNLYCDVVVGKKKVKSAELADLSVPDGNTLTYNGLVAHNTLGYTVLYGGEAPRIQQALLKEGHMFSLERCGDLQQTFYKVFPKIRRTIDQIHEKLKADLYSSSPMGRKRFFELPPKWRKSKYEKALQEALREGTNHKFQACNADATKISMVRLGKYYEDTYEILNRPLIVLNVHDELVQEWHFELEEDVINNTTKIMTEAGEEAVLHKCPIEVSHTISKKWQK